MGKMCLDFKKVSKIFARFKRKKFSVPLIGLAAIVILLYGLEQAGLKIPSLIEMSLLVMTPLGLAAVGESINQKAGLINIGLEGIFLISAVIGVYAAVKIGSGVLGVLIGSLAGAFIGLLFAVICVYGRANQIVAGMGINIIAIGFVPFFMMTVWRSWLLTIPQYQISAIFYHPIRLQPVTVLAIIAAILASILLYKTLFGLRIRAAGEKPEAVDVAGVRVDRIRLFTATLGGALCGLGGAFLALGWFGGIVKEISAGRGFIALACVVCAGLRPLRALGFAFMFGFAEALAVTIAILYKDILPENFIYMIPYIVTLVAVIIVGKAMFPQAIGKPYVRE